MDELVVPVMDEVRAAYVVPMPAFTTAEDVAQAIGRAIAETVTGKRAIQLPEPFGAFVLSWLDEGVVRISVLEGLDSAAKTDDVSPEFRRFLNTAPAFAVITAAHPASLVAVQEWRARATAAALAASLGAGLFEVGALRLLDVRAVIASLPQITLSGQITFDARPWITSHAFQYRGRYWAVSDGMSYFGLPDLRVGGTTRDLRDELAEIVNGLACHILCCLAEDVREAGGDAAIMTLPRQLGIPEVLEFHREQLDGIRGIPNRGGGSTEVRFNLSDGSTGRRWLTLGPPPGWDADAEEFIGGLCHAMFGFEKPSWHYLPVMRAVVESRDGIPAARCRFLAGDLPERGQLLVRYRVGIDSEFTWARVSSWSDEDHVVVRDIGCELGPGIRVGNAKTVATQQIVDWAIWVDGTGVVEGGLTEAIAT